MTTACRFAMKQDVATQSKREKFVKILLTLLWRRELLQSMSWLRPGDKFDKRIL